MLTFPFLKVSKIALRILASCDATVSNPLPNIHALSCMGTLLWKESQILEAQATLLYIKDLFALNLFMSDIRKLLFTLNLFMSDIRKLLVTKFKSKSLNLTMYVEGGL